MFFIEFHHTNKGVHRIETSLSLSSRRFLACYVPDREAGLNVLMRQRKMYESSGL